MNSRRRLSETIVTPLNRNRRAAPQKEVVVSQSSGQARRQEGKGRPGPEGSARGTEQDRDAMNKHIASVYYHNKAK